MPRRRPPSRRLRADPRFLNRDESLNRDEVERLAEAAGEYGDVVHLLAYTGLRFSEMAALRVSLLVASGANVTAVQRMLVPRTMPTASDSSWEAANRRSSTTAAPHALADERRVRRGCCGLLTTTGR